MNIYKHIKYLQLFVTHIVKFATVADQFIKKKTMKILIKFKRLYNIKNKKKKKRTLYIYILIINELII